VKARSRLTAVAARTLALGALVAGAAGCNASTSGLRIDVTMNEFATTVTTLKISVSAAPDGFDMPTMPITPGVTISTSPDATGKPGLVLQFAPPFSFGNGFSFRLDTANQNDVTIVVSALGFDGSGVLKAGVDAETIALPAGGAVTAKLDLKPKSGQTNPTTRTTDLGMTAADLTVQGSYDHGHLTALAVCDLDHDGSDDVIIGAPDVAGPAMLGTGAVYVVFGGGSAATINLGSPAAASVFQFYGAGSGDRLGAAVACGDVNADSTPDLVVGAPGGTGGTGHVYVVLGGTNLKGNRTVDFAMNRLPDLDLTTSVTSANLGAGLYVADLDGDGRAEILASAPGPGAKTVHLFTKVALSAAPVDIDSLAHVTFSGLAASAIASGNFTGNTDPLAPADIVLGDASFRLPSDQVARGAVYTFSGVAPSMAKAFNVTAGDPAGPTVILTGQTPGAQYGAAVLAFDSGMGDDLLVGVPNDGGGDGAVFVYENSPNFLNALMPDSTPGLTLPHVTAGEHFGSALGRAASGSPGSGSWRLFVGAPAATPVAGRASAGAAYVLLGNRTRTFPLSDQVFGAAAGDALGGGVAGGQIDGGDTVADMAAAAPFAPGAATEGGVVYVRYGQP
jgi:hypothetical protein